ncbi:MAG TPA: TraR/DksA C4-type zinc finger protein [Steroidobacteraceae bacterium]
MAPQIHGPGRTARGEYARFEHKLRQRWRALRDVNPAEVTREVQEIRAIEGALKRMALGTYGVCVSCGQPIEHERLEAHPTANRCAACQRVYEHGYATRPTPRL